MGYILPVNNNKSQLLNKLQSVYKHWVLDRPAITLIATLLFVAFLALFAGRFELDASADSLILENDKDLNYYRAISAKYGSDGYLVVTYSPKGDLFAQDTLDDIEKLRDKLRKIERVGTVTTILDVPLINSPRIDFEEIQKRTPKLRSPGTDIELARKEFTEGPLYRNLLVSADGKTTVLQVIFKRDKKYERLLRKRGDLRAKRLDAELTPEEEKELDVVTKEFKVHTSSLTAQQQTDIARVRAILDEHRDKAEIYLGGIPMIISDMIEYIGHDIRVFGLGVLALLVLLLTIFFRKPRWVLLPMVICSCAGIGIVGLLGLLGWRVTVVSSNFISLMLIITLSLTVHLIVRYRELHRQTDNPTQKDLVWETLRSKFQPSAYTTATTMVAFASLIVSGIRPVIDFGWMMVLGMGLAFVLAFLLFPAGMMFLKPGQASPDKDMTVSITSYVARFIEKYNYRVLIAYGLIILLSVTGMLMLKVENRFIDYFKESTEIYQGMVKIDKELGGTTPLDVILEPDKDFYEYQKEIAEDDLLFGDEDAGISGNSYWFNIFKLQTVGKVHEYLESLPETGKVLSMATTMKLLTQLNNDEPLSNIFLAVMHKRLPEEIKKTLFDPYMSADGNQIRFSIRVFESDPNLRRQVLLDKIRADLQEKFGFEKEQIKLTGMVVLYNNMLQSLFRSQILTLGVVFIAIMFMFVVLFRSFSISAIAIVPNLVAAGFILGLMGWLGIHLDLMTITIAAITIGIGVDDTIHFVHRFMEEYPKDKDYWAAIKRCHASIGKAMYYTSVTITLGFSVLVLSSFIPTINFGLLTGMAMLVALVANLTLLPVLLVTFKPIK